MDNINTCGVWGGITVWKTSSEACLSVSTRTFSVFFRLWSSFTPETFVYLQRSKQKTLTRTKIKCASDLFRWVLRYDSTHLSEWHPTKTAEHFEENAQTWRPIHQERLRDAWQLNGIVKFNYEAQCVFLENDRKDTLQTNTLFFSSAWSVTSCKSWFEHRLRASDNGTSLTLRPVLQTQEHIPIYSCIFTGFSIANGCKQVQGERRQDKLALRTINNPPNSQMHDKLTIMWK